jgi:tetratricopeptide (TPR) repeat protein
MKRAKKNHPQQKTNNTDRNNAIAQLQNPSLYQSSHSAEQSYALALQHYFESHLPQAERICRQILQAEPDQPHALHLLGVIAHQMGDFDAAFELIKKALINKPDYSDAHNNLGNVLKDLNKFDDALTSFHQALKIIPNSAEVHNNIGIVLNKLNRLDESVSSYKTALSKKPDYAEAHNNLGHVLKRQNMLEEALESYQKAITIMPEYVEAHQNLGVALQEMNMLDESIQSHSTALKIDPENVATKFYLSLSLLSSGDYIHGLPLFDYRLIHDVESVGTRFFPPPFWDGSNLQGQKILIWGEQGIGDEILYALFFSELISRGAHCYIECQPRLVNLFKRSFPLAKVYPRKEEPDPELLNPNINYQSPSGSLLQWLLAPFEKGEINEKYLLADRDESSVFRSRYRTNGMNKIVGIGWATSFLTEGWDNVPLETFDLLLEVPGVQFVSVQYGEHSAELEASFQRTGVKILEDKEVDPLQNMDSFASQLTSMDLVITLTNSTAALACALGVPTWGISSPIVDWRFGNKSENNLWYPSLRLFRQSDKTDWSSIAKDLAQAFKEYLD